MQQRRLVAVLFGDVYQRRNVFAETGAAPAHAGVQKLRPDATVKTEAAHDLFDVGAHAFADVGDFVRETDLGGEERVGRVFDHLRRSQISRHYGHGGDIGGA